MLSQSPYLCPCAFLLAAVRLSMLRSQARLKDRLRSEDQGADTVLWLAFTHAATEQLSSRFFQGDFLLVWRQSTPFFPKPHEVDPSSHETWGETLLLSLWLCPGFLGEMALCLLAWVLSASSLASSHCCPAFFLSIFPNSVCLLST